MVEDEPVVDFYEPPERKVALNLRVEESLKRGLENVVKMWRALAIARGHDPKIWDVTEVTKRLLRVGIEGAFTEAMALVGLKRLPTTDAEWSALEAALEKQATDRLVSTPPQSSKKSRR